MSAITWLKHRARLASPRKDMRRLLILTIMVSFGDALSQVTHRSYEPQVSNMPTIVICKLTLPDIPNSLSICTKAAARLAPECDTATSTTSSIKHIGVPSLSKWTVTATNTLWFGDVHASVAKLNAPSYSCNIVAIRFQAFAKTFLTSRDTVAGEGM